MKGIGNKRNASSSQNTSEQDREGAESQGADKMDIVEVSLTNRENAMFV